MATAQDTLKKAMALLDDVNESLQHTLPASKCSACSLAHKILELKLEAAAVRVRKPRAAVGAKPGTTKKTNENGSLQRPNPSEDGKSIAEAALASTFRPAGSVAGSLG